MDTSGYSIGRAESICESPINLCHILVKLQETRVLSLYVFMHLVGLGTCDFLSSMLVYDGSLQRVCIDIHKEMTLTIKVIPCRHVTPLAVFIWLHCSENVLPYAYGKTVWRSAANRRHWYTVFMAARYWSFGAISSQLSLRTRGLHVAYGRDSSYSALFRREQGVNLSFRGMRPSTLLLWPRKLNTIRCTLTSISETRRHT
jgi:hypothetical protein